jgi:hypothetical protein
MFLVKDQEVFASKIQERKLLHRAFTFLHWLCARGTARGIVIP